MIHQQIGSSGIWTTDHLAQVGSIKSLKSVLKLVLNDLVLKNTQKEAFISYKVVKLILGLGIVLQTLIFHCLAGIVVPIAVGPNWKSSVLQAALESANTETIHQNL